MAALAIAGLSQTVPCRGVRSFSRMLLGFWAAYYLIDGRIELLDSVQFSAGMDALGMSVAMFAAMRRASAWRAVLAACFAGQLLTHIALMFLPDTQTSVFEYKLILNLLFIGELAAVASPSVSFHLRQWRLRPAARSVSA